MSRFCRLLATAESGQVMSSVGVVLIIPRAILTRSIWGQIMALPSSLQRAEKEGMSSSAFTPSGGGFTLAC